MRCVEGLACCVGDCCAGGRQGLLWLGCFAGNEEFHEDPQTILFVGRWNANWYPSEHKPRHLYVHDYPQSLTFLIK